MGHQTWKLGRLIPVGYGLLLLHCLTFSIEGMA